MESGSGVMGAGLLGVGIVVVDRDFFGAGVVVEGSVFTRFLLHPEGVAVGKGFWMKGAVVALDRVWKCPVLVQ